MKGAEGVEAFHIPAGYAYASDPGAVAPEVFGMDLVHGSCAYLFLRDAHSPFGFEAGDGRRKSRAGDPEASRHLAAALVLYYAREAGGAPGCHAKRYGRLSTELERDGLVVCIGVRHQLFLVHLSLLFLLTDPATAQDHARSAPISPRELKPDC